jgi:hypothetical protein
MSVVEELTPGPSETPGLARRFLAAPSMRRSTALAVVAALLVVSISRSPYIFIHGRFWAEEANPFFRHMVTVPTPRNLLFVDQRLGYSYLFLNVATRTAAQVSLLRAPLVTAWLSLAVVVSIVWIALRWPSMLLTSVGARIAAATLLVVGTLAVPEVWANSTNAQTYLAVLSILVLFSDAAGLSRRQFVASAFLLVVAGLSGLYTCVLFPVFGAVAYLDRSRRRMTQAAIIGATAAFQFGSLMYSRTTGALKASRMQVPNPRVTVHGFGAWHIGTFLFGSSGASHLYRKSFGLAGLSLLALFAVSVLVLVGYLLADTRGIRVATLLAGAFVLEEALVNWGGKGGGGSRYAVAPIAILTLAVICAATSTRQRWTRHTAQVLVGVILIAGLANFWTTQPDELRCIQCPTWSAQVHNYEANATNELRIWPYRGKRPWTLPLPPRSPPTATSSIPALIRSLHPRA